MGRRIGKDRMERKSPELAIVIPAWNEWKNLGLLLPAVKEEVADLGLSAEILVVDGGSHDGTREAAVARGVRTVVQQERGHGGATRRALTCLGPLVRLEQLLALGISGAPRRGGGMSYREIIEFRMLNRIG